MSRLTAYAGGEVFIDKKGWNPCDEICWTDSCDDCVTQKAFAKLAHYEDLEEQGRLVTLPCKVGDTVYWIHELPLCPHLDGGMEPSYVICESEFEYNDLDYLGEYVFLTKEEAEAKLAELKGE